MNTFFYAASDSRCRDNCCYETCSRKCLHLLGQVPALSELLILPGGSKLQTPRSMELRSGDIIILYAENSKDIDTLVSIRDFFDTFRVILIVGRNSLMQYAPQHHLSPRYTTSIDQNMNELGAIVDRMNEKSQYHSISENQLQEHNHE